MCSIGSKNIDIDGNVDKYIELLKNGKQIRVKHNKKIDDRCDGWWQEELYKYDYDFKKYILYYPVSSYEPGFYTLIKTEDDAKNYIKEVFINLIRDDEDSTVVSIESEDRDDLSTISSSNLETLEASSGQPEQGEPDGQTNPNMVNKKSWKKFRDSGLLWWINMILHTFGWAICMDMDDEEIVSVYPARVKFRGFAEKNNTDGYIKVSKFMKENADVLIKESEE